MFKQALERIRTNVGHLLSKPQEFKQTRIDQLGQLFGYNPINYKGEMPMSKNEKTLQLTKGKLTAANPLQGAFNMQRPGKGLSYNAEDVRKLFVNQGLPVRPAPSPTPPRKDRLSAAALPTPTPTPTPAPLIPNTIMVKGYKGEIKVPQHITEALMKTLDPIGEATNAANMLHHEWSQTFTPEEIKRVGRENWTYGENPEFITKNIDVPNKDGSLDRGLTRINSNTFNGMWNQQNPDGSYPWREMMKARGITSYEDMEDLNKNTEMMRLILERGNWDNKLKQIKKNPSYRQWYAAPYGLRVR